MKRYKVGEVFEYEGMILKAIEDDLKQEESGCKYCALNKFMCSNIDCGTRMNPSIRFIEVSKEKLFADALPNDLDLKPKKKSFWKRLMFWRKDV